MPAEKLTWSTQGNRNVPFVTPFVQFPCLRCSPLRSAFLNTQFTQVAIAQWKKKKPQPCLHVAQNTIITGVHVGEHGVWMCIFNMLCAINVYSEPNRHWQSKRKREHGELTACHWKRESGILKRREVGWLFCFSNSGNGDGGGQA